MARLPKDEEARWRYRIKELKDAGRNHHQIAIVLEDEGYAGSTRPQNIKRIMDNMDKGAYSSGDIVSPEEQKAKLMELTEMIEDDLIRIDAQIAILADNPHQHATKIEKLFKLKNELYKNVGTLWSLSESISGSKKGPASISGDKVQVNFAQLDYKKLHEAAKDATKALDEARDG
jgi:DNA-binding transcriptional MerR regulator